jgi:hypothetical protein
MRAFPATSWSDRSRAAMPPDRVAAQPWLIAGRLLFAPFAPRDGGLTAHEAEAIEARESVFSAIALLVACYPGASRSGSARLMARPRR